MNVRAAVDRPGRLLLQWHITERCNLRCSHCYQEDLACRELSLDDLLLIVEQFTELLSRWRVRHAAPSAPGRVTVTGGEPLVRRDLWTLLEALAVRRPHLEFGLLSNGNLLDGAAARRLAELGVEFVQVSLDGDRTTHDRVRGDGSFDRAVAAVERLVDEGIRTVIAFTAHRANYRSFAEVARLGVRLGVDRVWADRMVPHGRGARSLALLLGPPETRELFEIMRRARVEASRSFCRTEIFLGRALQFLVGGGTPYRCGAGERLLTLMPDGTVYPCRRMPVPVGNVTRSTLAEIYERAGLLRALRDRDRHPQGCGDCRHLARCGGGLRCLSYALTGDPFVADPGCWHAAVRAAAS